MSEELNDIQLKTILESILFVNENPVETSEFVQVLSVDKKKIEKLLIELGQDYKSRASGICVVKVAGGYQMCSSPDNAAWVKKMFRERTKQKMSVAGLETLAIIAYKQPITRMEIEAIRGVNADGVTRNLLSLGLIKTAGRKEVPGRPFLHITTRKFLEYFGLNSVKDLPKLEEFAALAEKDSIVDEIIHADEAGEGNTSEQNESVVCQETNNQGEAEK
ncbi:MAG: SMC-Scp complex subunit ScpB [Candidatus Omnitrophica bacterium]|nr:SMC-Scp complex subunit ScpB [Candidatus Omnitrophota bacterium]